MPQKTCIVFAKWPEPGRVKTRLAAGCNSEFACNFYRICCEHIVSEAQRCVLFTQKTKHAGNKLNQHRQIMDLAGNRSGIALWQFNLLIQKPNLEDGSETVA